MSRADILSASCDALSVFDAGQPLRAATNFWATFAANTVRQEMKEPFTSGMAVALLWTTALKGRVAFEQAMSKLIDDEPTFKAVLPNGHVIFSNTGEGLYCAIRSYQSNCRHLLNVNGWCVKGCGWCI